MTLDATQLMDLKIAIGDRLFIQISSWNLYLSDAGLAEKLAIECAGFLGESAGVAARKALESVQVELGGGSTRIPLSRLIPPGQIYDLEEILDPYCK